MSTISPSFQAGGSAAGWKIKEGAILGWQDDSGLFKPAGGTFTRNSGNATYIDANGLIQTEYRDNWPRITYSGGRACLMNEEARTNLSNDNQTPSSWYNTILTPTDEGAFELNGTGVSFNWGKYTQSGTTNNFAFTTGTISTSDDFAISLYVKISESGDYIGVREVGNGVGVARISTETITTAGGGLTSIQVFDTINSDIKRVIIKGTSATGGNVFLQLPSSTGDYGVDDGNTFQLTAFQIEVGAYASSVIPTEGAAATRAAESIEWTGIGNFLGDSEGGLYVEAAAFAADSTAKSISISDGSINNSVRIRYNTSNNIAFDPVAGGSTVAVGSTSGVNTTNFNKIFAAYALNDLAFYVGGNSIATGSSFAAYADGTLTATSLSRGGSGEDFRGLIHEIKIYDQRPDNTQLETDTQ